MSRPLSKHLVQPQRVATPLPLNIHVFHPGKQVEIEWDDGLTTKTDFVEFRRYCACAWCRQQGLIGHDPAPESSVIKAICAVGEVGINIAFTDGHDRGLFPWEYLRTIADGTIANGSRGNASDE
ncbi:DUF971 domain-containing protein [Ketobacter sp. MCCC 1A13808]|uniref:DUF971 domain-containing protein n=1 Tax=Ketobacter sp. MCCC 1A13808 TaxID=2602738 RepID=UPI0012EC6D09|nr:DUF971 domain-containing protein [Ketobacter sp. MCCC 1A13808]MVF14301.1 DUF971 domain-containing protein [Ketobacter sp. MCCC 1A13808]